MKYIIVICCLFFVACSPKQEQEEEPAKPIPHFQVKHYYMDSSEEYGIPYIVGEYLILDKQNGYSVLDKNYQHNKEIEKLLNPIKAQYKWVNGDTLWLCYNYNDSKVKRWYYYNGAVQSLGEVSYNYFLKKYFFDFFTHVTFPDYTILPICYGEFGGYAFFNDRKHKKTYGWYGTCVSQILYMDSSYYMVNNLNHLGFYSCVSKIKDPTKLLEVKYYDDIKLSTEVFDSCRNYYRNYDRTNDIEGYSRYGESLDRLLNITFIYNDELYSVAEYQDTNYSDWVSYYTIMKHENDSLIEVQTIDSSNNPLNASTQLAYGHKAYAAFVYKGRTAADIIVAQGNKIDILHYSNKAQ